MKHVAIYVRVSDKSQNTDSQLPELQRWAAAQEQPCEWYEDKATGKTMDRPGWNRLYAALNRGLVHTIVVWRLDRLGRTARGLTALFEEIIQKKVNLVSLRDGLDLGTPSGRLMANMLASVAQFETEIRVERINAGIAAARAKGKTWGGSQKGVRRKVTPEQENGAVSLRHQGVSISAIARILKMARPTVYSVLRAHPEATPNNRPAT